MTNLHHAYAIVGDQNRSREIVEALLTDELELDTKNNPDIREFTGDVYTIDDARGLKADHYLKGVQGKAIHIIRCNSMTTEAQQSLLKVCEDPVANVHFFFLLPTLQGILPTLRSRFYIITHDGTSPSEDEKDTATSTVTTAKKFLAAKPADRINSKSVKAILEEKDKQAALTLVNHLETAIAEKIADGNTEYTSAARDLIQARTFLHTRAPSVKMIIEHLCLTLPQVY